MAARLVILAAGSTFWPLFLHVLGAISLFGAVGAACLLAWAGWRRPAPVLARASFASLLAGAVPAWIVMRLDAQWIYSREGYTGHGDPAWLTIGFGVADDGLILLLACLGVAYWWRRGGRALAGRLLAVLSSGYVALLALAWLAMTAKW